MAPAGLFAIAAAFGSITYPAAANAEWDIGAYDTCMNLYHRPAVNCCLDSGGVWTGNNAGEGKCVAPPANENFTPTPQTPVPRAPVGPLPTVASPSP
jgi:hypothetical protein